MADSMNTPRILILLVPCVLLAPHVLPHGLADVAESRAFADSGGGGGGGGHGGGDDGPGGGASQGRWSGVWGSSGADTARRAVVSGEAQPLGEVLSVVGKRTPGKVLEVDLNPASSGWQYNLLILDSNQRYLDVTVDARSLRVLSVRSR